jgi:photosystem II stability/assembly factor-like uncharacterized protein
MKRGDASPKKRQNDAALPAEKHDDRNRLRPIAICAALALLGMALPASAATIGELIQQTHIHGLAVDPSDGEILLVATHHGLYRVSPDGEAELVSPVQDFMGFSLDPREAGSMYASGHPPNGGNLGFIASTNGGKTWSQVSPGAGGPVDFHQIAVSLADPKTIYGSYRGLQVSHDEGKSWAVVGPAPDALIDLAASAKSADVLYAATETGLLMSTDAGKTWSPLVAGVPVTLVETTAAGDLYAFFYGQGLVKAREGTSDFVRLGYDAPGGFLLHLAVHPADPRRFFAADNRGRIVTSGDEGKTWTVFGG